MPWCAKYGKEGSLGWCWLGQVVLKQEDESMAASPASLTWSVSSAFGGCGQEQIQVNGD